MQYKTEVTLTLNSAAFKDGDKIPIKYTCDGQDISPPLLWGEPPPLTETFALVVDDLDAPGGVFTHWVLFNLPATVRQLGENITVHDRLESGALQGKNDFGGVGYGRPCPPHGAAHRYRFTIYALDQSLDLKPGISRGDLTNAMKGHILGEGQLVVSYQR